jgi:hypothetical protein
MASSFPQIYQSVRFVRKSPGASALRAAFQLASSARSTFTTTAFGFDSGRAPSP